MSKDILLIVHTPLKKTLEKRVAKVVIPAFAGKLTILPDRAPSEILLNEGILTILDENAEVLEEYKIGKGVADVADDICNIYTELAEKI